MPPFAVVLSGCSVVALRADSVAVSDSSQSWSMISLERRSHYCEVNSRNFPAPRPLGGFVDCGDL